MAMNPAADNVNANFRVNIGNYLNIQHSLYLDSIKGVAYSTPSAYFLYRKTINDHIRTESISNLYNTLFNALKSGYKSDGRTPIADPMIGGSPNLSEVKINEIIISISKSLDSQLQQIIDILAPAELSSMAYQRTNIRGQAEGVN